MASDSTADPGAKRLALETLPPSKRSMQTNDDNAKMAWENDLFGIIATYLDLGPDLTHMVVALAAGRQSEGKDIARVVKGVYFRGNNVYLYQVFSSLLFHTFSVNDERWENTW